jgi:hypothetical protein
MEAAAPAPPRAAPEQPWAAGVTAFDPATHTRATVRYTAEAWGTAMEIRVIGIPAGTACQLWATSTRDQESADRGLDRGSNRAA